MTSAAQMSKRLRDARLKGHRRGSMHLSSTRRPIHTARRSGCCHAAAASDDSASAGALPSLSDLEALLEAAVAGENYTRAAELRDAIGNAMHDSHVAVRHVNNQFYKAFASGDMDAMRRLWGEGDHVQCCHPGVKNLVGRDDVIESWSLILGKGNKVDISVEGLQVCVREGMAFVTCVEVVDAGDSRGWVAATNVFELQGERWRIVHHHGSPLPPQRG